jgi:hypothetical protein
MIATPSDEELQRLVDMMPQNDPEAPTGSDAAAEN